MTKTPTEKIDRRDLLTLDGRVMDLENREAIQFLEEEYSCPLYSNAGRVGDSFVFDLGHPYRAGPNSKGSNISGIISELKAYALARQGVFSYDSATERVTLSDFKDRDKDSMQRRGISDDERNNIASIAGIQNALKRAEEKGWNGVSTLSGIVDLYEAMGKRKEIRAPAVAAIGYLKIIVQDRINNSAREERPSYQNIQDRIERLGGRR
jgi:hypothetical protein